MHPPSFDTKRSTRVERFEQTTKYFDKTGKADTIGRDM